MNYATQHHTGHHPIAQQKTTRAITSTIGRVYGISTTSQRLQRNPKRQKAVSSNRPTPHGFLKTTFLPKLQVSEAQIKLSKKEVKQLERDFYNSVSELEKHYGISVLETKKYSYPYNLSLACWNAEQQLKKHSKSHCFDALQIVQEDAQIAVRVIEKYETGNCLYYIPIVPLFRLLKNPQKQQSAQLLLSIFCYLYRVVGVPFYREDDSYLYWFYDMITEWHSEEEDSEEKEKTLSEIRKATCIGDCILQKIQSKENLIYWESRLQTFRVEDDFDQKCVTIATQFFDLYKQYENRHIYLNINRGYQESYGEEYLTIDKYISFVADTNDSVFDQLFEVVNNDFSEYGEIEEPTIQKHFNGRKMTTENLDFENKVFKLITQLCQLLT